MRLFIAVNPDPYAIEHLEQAVDPLRCDPDLASMRWTPASRWHLTLAFIGDVDDSLLPGLVRRLRSGLEQVPAPEPVRCASAGAFGDRLLWIGLSRADERGQHDHREPPLRGLARLVQRLARQSRMPVDAKAWMPHLTIGRSRPGGSADRAAARLADYLGPSWRPNEIMVMSSILGPSPVHEVQAVIPIAGSKITPG